MKKALSNIIAGLWFFGVILGTLFFGTIAVIMIIFSDILPMLRYGFAISPIGLTLYFLFSLIFALTGVVPVFRKCYYKLPWLYPYSMIMMAHLLILGIGEEILNVGFSVMGQPRHAITIIIFVIQLVVCRFAMCIHFRKHPMMLRKGERVE